ncbi:helix-turn-helix domain-containing protein [Facklamia hominis]|uniref:LexA family transcriptional regulator n=1 Tax=Facklamia hominis TaxID=178214 RepID=A0AAJ1V441_9LACT|nr:LexA family transcriptional regulator [Facklamia hominis]
MIDLKSRRLELGLTLEDVGDMVGVGKSTVRKWENGMIDNMKRDKIALLAHALQISPLQILSDDYQPTNNIISIYNQLNKPRQNKVYTFAQHQLDEQNNGVEESSAIYLVGQTAAGEPLEYGQLQPEQISVDVPKGADRALNVKGDSMEPLIKDGSIVFYKDQPTVENGEIAIVEIDGSEVTCKKFYFDGDKITLKSINEKYEDMVFSNGVRIIGKVII